MKSESYEKTNRMVVATFAEVGEWETARQMMINRSMPAVEMGWFDRIFMAIAFAEADWSEC